MCFSQKSNAVLSQIFYSMSLSHFLEADDIYWQSPRVKKKKKNQQSEGRKFLRIEAKHIV